MFETHKKGEKTDAQVGLVDREVGKSAVGIRRKKNRQGSQVNVIQT
jgi:hypothetical protein